MAQERSGSLARLGAGKLNDHSNVPPRVHIGAVAGAAHRADDQALDRGIPLAERGQDVRVLDFRT